MPRARKTPEYTQCLQCGVPLPEGRRSDMRFCPPAWEARDLNLADPTAIWTGATTEVISVERVRRHPCKDAWNNALKGRSMQMDVFTTEPLTGPHGEDLGDRTCRANGPTVKDDGGHGMFPELWGPAPFAVLFTDPDLDIVNVIASDQPGQRSTKGGPADPTGSYATMDATKRRPAPLPIAVGGPAAGLV